MGFKRLLDRWMDDKNIFFVIFTSILTHMNQDKDSRIQACWKGFKISSKWSHTGAAGITVSWTVIYKQNHNLFQDQIVVVFSPKMSKHEIK